ncbi:hypothetical protein [Lactococcus lactis]|uniref:hypothetical protein n=1 Tax=Lactococcus lactis TaxID=1358 RepID=UPI00189765B8|nr:hypothetical protein [Lactococcus lactis]
MNKAEKLRAYELNDMASNIVPLSGLGSRTQTTIDIGKSWIEHAPLLQHLKTALDANVWLCGNDKSEDTVEFYGERYNTSVNEFYEYLGEVFDLGNGKRPVVDWL